MANEADAGSARRTSAIQVGATSRGAIIWRAGNGPRPTPEHLTPKDAEERLDAILRELETEVELPEPDEQQATLAAGHSTAGSLSANATRASSARPSPATRILLRAALP